MIDFDGNKYKTAIFNGITWTIENLRVTKYANGDSILYAETDEEYVAAGSTGEGVWCLNGNDTERTHSYGLLYNWYAVHRQASLSPFGWRIPTQSDWDRLAEYIDSLTAAEQDEKLKLFCGNFSGSRGINGSFGGQDITAYWWRQMPELKAFSWGRKLGKTGRKLELIDGFQRFGFAVRCVKVDG